MRIAVRAAAALSLGVALSACAGGGGGPGEGGSARDLCALYDRLGETATQVEQADVSDPERFEASLQSAVDQYVASVEDLREVAPDELHEDLDRLGAAAAQFRFDDALDARVSLDEYAAERCSSATPTTAGG